MPVRNRPDAIWFLPAFTWGCGSLDLEKPDLPDESKRNPALSHDGEGVKGYVFAAAASKCDDGNFPEHTYP